MAWRGLLSALQLLAAALRGSKGSQCPGLPSENGAGGAGHPAVCLERGSEHSLFGMGGSGTGHAPHPPGFSGAKKRGPGVEPARHRVSRGLKLGMSFILEVRSGRTRRPYNELSMASKAIGVYYIYSN